jgi:iron complex outermembrane receptor protein
MKTEWLDGQMRLNGSVFYYDYEDFQAFYFAGTTSLMINSDAKFHGGELELIYSPGNGWDVLAGLALLDTSVDVPARPASPGVENQKAPLAPDLSWNGMIRKTWELENGGSVSGLFSGFYVSDQYFNVINAPTTKGGDYTLLDASISYAPSDRMEFTVFMNNITDKEALTYSYDISAYGRYTIQVYGPPRWVGARMRLSF